MRPFVVEQDAAKTVVFYYNEAKNHSSDGTVSIAERLVNGNMAHKDCEILTIGTGRC